MKSSSIRLNVKNPMSISVSTKRITTIGHILKIFGPYLINSDLRFHIFKLFSQRNLKPKIILMNILKVLRENSVNNIYF